MIENFDIGFHEKLTPVLNIGKKRYAGSLH